MVHCGYRAKEKLGHFTKRNFEHGIVVVVGINNSKPKLDGSLYVKPISKKPSKQVSANDKVRDDQHKNRVLRTAATVVRPAHCVTTTNRFHTRRVC